MAVRADVISNRRRVQRALQAVGFVALLSLAVGAALAASGAFAGGLTASSVKLAYAPLLTDTPTSTPNPCAPVWSVASSPSLNAFVDVLSDVDVVSANDVWAVGHYYTGCGGCTFRTLIEHWDGISWSLVPSPNIGSASNQLWGVAAVSANDVWAVGCYDNCDNISRTLIEHWNGTSWSVVSSPNPGTGHNYLNRIAAVSATDVWAVGYYCTLGGSDCTGVPFNTLIEHWNGTSWSVVSSPNPGTSANLLRGMTAVAANDVWAVGQYSNGGPSQTLVEHWNGSSWSVVSSPNVGTSYNILYGVAAASANDVWAVGDYTGDFGNQYTLIEHWDGTSWSVASSPNRGTLTDVDVVTANDIWAVSIWAVNGTIMHWDGRSWSVVPSPSPYLGANLYGIAAASADELWAVGEYVISCGVNCITNHTLVEHYATLCGTPTSTPTNTPTITPTNTVTSTPTITPTPSATTTINGHLTWQGVAPTNRPSVTGTLQLCVGGATQTFPFTTNTDGYFTVTVPIVLPDGTYHWRTKGGRHISSSSPADGADLVIINGYATQEFGTQRSGDAYSNNIVNAEDFHEITLHFGQSGIRASDFDYNQVVNAQDFVILKTHFGQAGHTLTCP